MNARQRRPLRALVRAGDRLVDLIILLLILLLLAYSAYAVWYSRALTAGSFLSAEMAMFKPDTADPSLEELIALNPDVRCWLTLDDTHIDYPVVQGKNDYEYLNKDVEGRFSLAGSIFLSAANTPDLSDPYNVAYGHHIEGGAMFSDVLTYRDAAFFDSHLTGTLWAPAQVYDLRVFACIEVDALDTVVYQPPEWVTADRLPEICAYALDHAVQSRPPELQPDERVLVLSTCEDATSFDRVLLFCVMTAVDPDAVPEESPVDPEPVSVVSDPPGEAISCRDLWRLLPWGLLIILLILVIWWLMRRRRRKA